MRLTQYTDYSLRVLTYLALCDGLATIAQIADAYGISRNHLMKVVQQLVRTGFVESIRGQGGGLRLAMRAEDIVVGQVVRAMEPEIGLVECQRVTNACVISPACKLQHLLARAREAFFDELDKTTLRGLLPRGVKADLVDLLSIDA